ncbi:MAG: (d)CMP kinase [Clostridia bacterium]|nr:(d)CMP kinase [Clostridia bacterium]
MYQIAIDGPSGAGKSSLAKALAKRLGFIYVDTGALYRTIGYYAASHGANTQNADEVTALLGEITLSLAYEDGTQTVILNGESVGDKIRTPEASMHASNVSKIPAVRTFLLDTQRNIAEKNSVIMDGRDIGTVILPKAQVKIFLVSSFETRAMRRVKELKEKGIEASYEDVLADMIARDRQDATREIAPAVPAEDAVHLDNSLLTFDETVEAAMAIIAPRIGLV